MAAEESPMKTMSSANTEDTKRNSLIGKLQIEIQCSRQKKSTILIRYKPRKGGKNNQNNNKNPEIQLPIFSLTYLRIVSLGMWWKPNYLELDKVLDSII